MSMKKVKEILDRAHKDGDFKKGIIENPTETLKDYHLPPELLARFASLDLKKIDKLRLKLEARLAKDGSIGLADNDFWVESVSD